MMKHAEQNNGLVKFNLITANEFWDILKSAHDFHVSRRDQYQTLLDLLKSRGVSLKDIKPHLLNQAKKAGLYNRSQWNEGTKSMEFRSYSDLLKCKYSWIVAMNNFLVWVKANYRDYNISVDHVRAEKAPKVKVQTVRRRTTDAEGNVTESSTTTESSTVEVPSRELVGPVSGELSVLQIQQIIMQNLSVLGEFCKGKSEDALQAFNDLMVELEQFDEIIDLDESEVVNEVEEMIAAIN